MAAVDFTIEFHGRMARQWVIMMIALSIKAKDDRCCVRYVVCCIRCAVTAVTVSARAVFVLILLFSGGPVDSNDAVDSFLVGS